MTTVAAIRTHRWTADEQRLWEVLWPVFGDQLTVVFHNFKGQPGLPVAPVTISDEWLTDRQLRVLADWGWRCGDYFYYALRQARPEADHYWLIEPDVLFRGDAADFFGRFEAELADALGAWYGPPREKHMFLRGVTDHAPMQAIFPLTRLSGRAIDWLLGQRQAYSKSRIRDHAFTNDEMFVFSWLSSQPEMTVKGLEAVAPEWFAGTHFVSNPDILMRAATDPSAPMGLYHPVRETDSYCEETGRRIVGTQRFQNMLAPSLGFLDPTDADRIGASVARHLKTLLNKGRGGDV